jgi:hypothetical protein
MFPGLAGLLEVCLIPGRQSVRPLAVRVSTAVGPSDGPVYGGSAGPTAVAPALLVSNLQPARPAAAREDHPNTDLAPLHRVIQPGLFSVFLQPKMRFPALHRGPELKSAV